MHYRFLTIFVFISLIFPSLVLSNQERTTPVALVNGIPIQKYDLTCALEADQARSGTIMIGSAKGKIKVSIRRASRKVLDRLINIELLYQEGLKHRFTGLSVETEKRYQREVMKAGGEEELTAALACNTTVQQDLKKSIFRNLVINRYLEKTVYSHISITDGEIREYYNRNLSRFTTSESVRARQVLIRVWAWKKPEETESALSKAMKIHKEASTGVDFKELALKYSEDTYGGTRGGEMGLIQKGSMPRVIDSNLFAMSVGEYTKPIKTRLGYHIIQITEKTPSSVRSLDEVKDHIVVRIRNSKAKAMISRHVAELRSKSKVEVVMK